MCECLVCIWTNFLLVVQSPTEGSEYEKEYPYNSLVKFDLFNLSRGVQFGELLLSLFVILGPLLGDSCMLPSLNVLPSLLLRAGGGIGLTQCVEKGTEQALPAPLFL